jgi:NADH-ubiquinone oxidoreductase chain 5
LHLTFLSNPNGYKSVICSAYDSSYSILFSLCALSIPSIFIGYLTKDMIIGMGTDFWGNSIFVLPEHMNLIDAEFIEHKFKILPVILSLSGATSSFILYSYFNNTLFSIKISYLGKKFYNFFSKKWFFDKVYNEYITQSLFKFSYFTSYKLIDRGIIEILGPMGLSSLITKQAKIFYKLQTGSIYHYSFTILLVLTILIGVRQFWLLFGLVLDYKVFVIIFITLCVFNSNENLEI